MRQAYAFFTFTNPFRGFVNVKITRTPLARYS